MCEISIQWKIIRFCLIFLQENVHLEEKLNETQFNLHNLSEEHQETLEKLQQQRDEMVQERIVHAQVLLCLYSNYLVKECFTIHLSEKTPLMNSVCHYLY